MEKVLDINGREIEVGDIIAYAMREGDSAIMRLYKIVEFKEKDNYARPAIQVKARCIHSPGGYFWQRDSEKVVTLYGELFKQRAIFLKEY